jgi:plasmid maintenance system killer protein
LVGVELPTWQSTGGALAVHTVRRRTQAADARQRCRSGRSAIAPGNRLEKLAGDRKGQFSVRINDQWRICFRWAEGGAWDVEIVDYH